MQNATLPTNILAAQFMSHILFLRSDTLKKIDLY